MFVTERLAGAGKGLDARGTIHGSLAIALFLLLLLKLSFVRLYKKYRPYTPLIGITCRRDPYPLGHSWPDDPVFDLVHYTARGTGMYHSSLAIEFKMSSAGIGPLKG